MVRDASSGSFDSAPMTLAANEFLKALRRMTGLSCTVTWAPGTAYPMSSLKVSRYPRTATMNLGRFAGVSEAQPSGSRGPRRARFWRDGVTVRRRNPERVARRLPKKLPDVLVEGLQILADSHHELVGVSAIDDAVVISQHQADDMTHGD